MENTEDGQSNNVQDAEDERVVEFRYRQLLPIILPTIVGVIGSVWFVAQLRNFTIGVAACALALVASVVALVIAGWAQTVTLNHWAVGASGGFLLFFAMTIALLGYPWFILLGLIIWLTVGALVVRNMEKSQSA